MLIALDIGNSTIAASVFSGNKSIAYASAPSTIQRSSDDTWQIIADLLYANQIEKDQIRAAGISSVVPFLSTAFTSLFREKSGIDPVIISSSLNIGINLHYDDPTTLGPDRISAAVAGFEKFGGPLIIVDFGTATTFGVVSATGDFLGGAIAFGVKSTADSLSHRTAQLPPFELVQPGKPICTNTTSAMQAGTMFGAVDAFEGMVRRIQRELGSNAKVIATGGLSELMAKQTTMIDAVEPRLVLEGVRLICERIQS